MGKLFHLVTLFSLAVGAFAHADLAEINQYLGCNWQIDVNRQDLSAKEDLIKVLQGLSKLNMSSTVKVAPEDFHGQNDPTITVITSFSKNYNTDKRNYARRMDAAQALHDVMNQGKGVLFQCIVPPALN